MLVLLAKILSNKNRDLFIVRLGSSLLLAKFGIVGGFVGALVGPFLRGFLGFLIEDGTYRIDLALDSYKEGAKLKEFEKAALDAYNKATAKIYDEVQKQAIREQYLKIISRIGTVGNPK